jgi:hypothetical protein
VRMSGAGIVSRKLGDECDENLCAEEENNK